MHFANSCFSGRHRYLADHAERENKIERSRTVRNLCNRGLADLAESALSNAGDGFGCHVESKYGVPFTLVVKNVVAGAASGIEDLQLPALKLAPHDRVGDGSHCHKPPEPLLEIVKKLKVLVSHAAFRSSGGLGPGPSNGSAELPHGNSL